MSKGYVKTATTSNLKSTRDAYGECLAELGKDSRIVVVDADLSASTRTERFAKHYPDRFFNVGCAEQNLIGVAAGLAYAGKIALASTYAIFSSRAWEVIRTIVAYDNLNVKIIVTHGGVTNGVDGASHHSLEDFAIMRAIPNMKVIVPADAVEAKKVIYTAVYTAGPFYVRLNRSATPVIFDPDSYRFELGKGVVLRDGSDVAIVACGTMVSKALEAADILEKEGIAAAVINMPSIKPIDRNLLEKLAAEVGGIVTVEEHSVVGGLGSAVAEAIVSSKPIPVEFVGFKDTFTETGETEELYAKFGLTAENIIRCAKRVIRRKCEVG